MSEPTGAPARPRQTTLALALVLGAGLIAVASAWETMTNIDSLATREMLKKLLAEPPWSNTGLSLATVHDVFRVSALVTGAGGAAAAILAGFAFKGDPTHRLALSVIAVPVTVAGFLVGGVATVLVGVSTFMLWLQPSRAWFNGEPIPEMFRQPGGRPARSGPDHAGATPGPATGQGWAAPDPRTRLGEPRRTPLTVLRPAIITGVFATGILFVALAVLLILATTPDTLMADVRKQDPSLFEQGLSEQQILAGLIAVMVLVVVWCVAALVLAVFLVRGREWARVALIVSAGLAGLAFALSSIANPLLLLGVAACVFAVLQLARPESVAWTRQR